MGGRYLIVYVRPPFAFGFRKDSEDPFRLPLDRRSPRLRAKLRASAPDHRRHGRRDPRCSMFRLLRRACLRRRRAPSKGRRECYFQSSTAALTLTPDCCAAAARRRALAAAAARRLPGRPLQTISAALSSNSRFCQDVCDQGGRGAAKLASVGRARPANERARAAVGPLTPCGRRRR